MNANTDWHCKKCGNLIDIESQEELDLFNEEGICKDCKNNVPIVMNY